MIWLDSQTSGHQQNINLQISVIDIDINKLILSSVDKNNWVVDCLSVWLYTVLCRERKRNIKKRELYFFYILSIGGCFMLIVNC